jgi:hypothetical protein
VPPPEFVAVIHFRNILRHRPLRDNAAPADRFRGDHAKGAPRTGMATPV